MYHFCMHPICVMSYVVWCKDGNVRSFGILYYVSRDEGCLGDYLYTEFGFEVNNDELFSYRGNFNIL